MGFSPSKPTDTTEHKRLAHFVDNEIPHHSALYRYMDIERKSRLLLIALCLTEQLSNSMPGMPALL